MNPKLKSLIGLARRAGKLVIGDESCMKAIRSGKAFLVLLASDASEGTVKRYADKCTFYKTELRIPGNRIELGNAIGRAEQVAIAVIDRGFADGIRSCMEKSEVQAIE